MPKKESFIQVLSDKRRLYGGRLLLNCNKISRPGEGKRANGAGRKPKLLSFPRRRESMGRIGLRLGFGLGQGLGLWRHSGLCSRPMDSRLRGNDTRGCIMRMLCGPAYVRHLCSLCY